MSITYVLEFCLPLWFKSHCKLAHLSGRVSILSFHEPFLYSKFFFSWILAAKAKFLAVLSGDGGGEGGRAGSAGVRFGGSHSMGKGS